MKSKIEYILAGIVIIILTAYLVIHKTDRTHYELPVIPELSQADITAITISKTDHPIELKLKDGKWMIYPEKYPADNSQIDAMVDIIKSLKLTALVSETKNYHPYELDPENKITIQAGNGEKVLRKFDIGKAAPSNRHTFIKLPEDDRVYHARESFRNKFDTTIDALRDNTVFTVDQDMVQQIDIKEKEKSIVLSLKQLPVNVDVTSEKKQPEENEEAVEKPVEPKMTWQDADGTQVEESKINSLLATLSKLQCKEYITDRTKDTFTAPIYSLTLHGADTSTLAIFEKINKDDDTYPATSSQNDYPFLLPAHRVENMMKKMKN